MAQTQTAAHSGAMPLHGAQRLRRVLGPDWTLGWGLLAPVVVVVLGLLAYPFANAILMSFRNDLIGSEGHWVGLENYIDFFTNPNSLFLTAAVNTIVITGAAIGSKFILGLSMASVLNQDLPAKNFWRGLLFIPWAIPAVVSAYAWRFLLDTTGPFNSLIVEYALRDDYIYFLSDPTLALISTIVVIVWSGTPFWTMNFLAGMQAISPELYEAADMDGAGTFQRFLHVTLPSLQAVILITVLLSTIWTSANLVQIFVLTNGGPQNATVTIPLLAYQVAIPGKQLGGGAAISMMMLPAYIVMVYFLTRRMLRQE